MILGVTGLIGSGKDTIADYLVTTHGFKRVSFAASLKDAVSSVFGWDREMLEGKTDESRAWREQPDVFWSKKFNKDVTPRWVLQYWGTEVCRRGFHDDIWIASVENKLRTSKDDIVISDCRFPNEILSIKNASGIIVCVNRGELPSWHIMAAKANDGDILAAEKLKALGVHASETAWVGTKFDYVLDNNSTLDSLFKQVETVVQPETVKI